LNLEVTQLEKEMPDAPGGKITYISEEFHLRLSITRYCRL